MTDPHVKITINKEELEFLSNLYGEILRGVVNELKLGHDGSLNLKIDEVSYLYHTMSGYKESHESRKLVYEFHNADDPATFELKHVSDLPDDQINLINNFLKKIRPIIYLFDDYDKRLNYYTAYGGDGTRFSTHV